MNISIFVIALVSALSMASESTAFENCRAPVKKNGVEIKVTEAERQACLKKAQILFEARDITQDMLNSRLESKDVFTNSSVVHCQFFKRQGEGKSAKFGCYRTDESGSKYYNKKGKLVSEAVGVDSLGNLVDARGKHILKQNGEPQEADELKVKYIVRNQWGIEERHREVFTEPVTTKIMWLLGMPADGVFQTSKVVCHGCGADPFHQNQSMPGARTSFEWAAVERKVEAKKIELRENQGWNLNEMEKISAPLALERRLEIEQALLGLALVGHQNFNNAMQNRLACLKGSDEKPTLDKQTGDCKAPVALFHDVGSTFGAYDANIFVQNSRADYNAFSSHKVFKNKATCELAFPSSQVRNISAEGLQRFLVRLNNITKDKIRNIFNESRFSQADYILRANVKRHNDSQGLKVTPAQFEWQVTELWVIEFMEGVDEIRSAKCPN